MSYKNLLLNVLGLLVLLALWSAGVAVLAQNLSLAKSLAPIPTFSHLYYLLTDNLLTVHIVASLKRVIISLLMALTIGVPVGLIIGQSNHLETASNGMFQLLRMTSPLSWMPIVVMLLGIGNLPICFLLTFAAVWPIILNTATGVKNIDSNWLQLGYSLSANRTEMLTKIILPAILGPVLTGLRLAIGVVWIVLVPCEMLGVNEGLGYFILDTRDRLAYSELMATILVIGLIGWGLDGLARGLHRCWLRQ